MVQRMPRRLFRFRLLPGCMALCGLFFGIKVVDVVQGTERLHQLVTNPAYAEAAKEEPKKETPEAKPEETKKAESADAEKKTEGEQKPEAEKKEGDAKKEGGEEKPKVNLPHTDTVAPKDTAQPFSQTEMDLLQSLSKRREEIDQYSAEVKLKENTLKATEMRLDQKLADLKALRAAMEGLLKQYNDKQDAQIRSLVKIYETMKPKDAARIFEELDMPTLLLVIDKMSERKAAPVLASMSAKKAKDVTVQLAEQRKAALPVVSGVATPENSNAPEAPSTKK